MKKILIVGATSAIAQEVIDLYAQETSHLYLLARNFKKLAEIKNKLKGSQGRKIEIAELNVNNLNQHDECLNKAFELLGKVDVILIAHGMLPRQKNCEVNAFKTLEALSTNADSTIALLTSLSSRMKVQGFGTIAVITSVAGDRARRSNYVYGASKAMVSFFLKGLRMALVPYGVQVLDIKPGPVKTPMLAHRKNKFLQADPKKVAKGIVLAIGKGKKMVYLPGYWRIIVWVMKMVPEFIFSKLKI